MIVSPAPKPLTIENYLRLVGLLYLFIGLFIFARRWNAVRAVHFYIFCLVSFILFSFHYTGKLNFFDWEIYWSKIAACCCPRLCCCILRWSFPSGEFRGFGLHRLSWSPCICFLPPCC